MATGIALQDRPETPSTLLARTLGRRSDAVAITDDSRTLDWASFAALAGDWARLLAEKGIEPGGAVAIRLPNGIDHLAAIFAIARLGAVAVHLNTRFGPAELQDVLARSAASVLITCDRVGTVDLTAALDALDRATLPALQHIITSGAMLPPGAPVPDAAHAKSPCLVFTSSGTTATPKLVVHDGASIAGHADDVARRIGLDQAGATLLAIMPFCGTFGNIAAMAAVAGGARIVCMAVYDAARAAALIRREAVTHLFCDDRILGQLADLAGGKPYESMRFSAVAAFHPDAVASIERGIAAGLVPHSIYGSSEVQALFALAPQAGGAQVKVVPVSIDAALRYRTDPDSPRPSDAGEGELTIDAPSAFSHYLGDPIRTGAARDAEGFFATGDLAEGDGGGFVFRARLGDVLRLGGFLVNPQEIEDFLQRQPGVATAQVVATLVSGRMTPFAFVVADEDAGPSEADLLATCRASLARYKVPARVVTIDAFPSIAGPNGVKIQRGRLREMADAIIAAGPPTFDPPAPVDQPATETVR